MPEADDPEYGDKFATAVAAVRKTEPSNVGDVNKLSSPERYFWYRYLFLGRGKPVSHIQALAELSDKDVAKECPAVLNRLLGRASKMLDGHLGKESPG